MSEEELSYDNDVVDPSYVDVDLNSEFTSTKSTKKLRTGNSGKLWRPKTQKLI